MIQTAVSLTNGRITGNEIQTIIDLAKAMIPPEMELFEHVAATVGAAQSKTHTDDHHQGRFARSRNIARSGIAQYFEHVQIVSHKSPASYRSILKQHGIPAERFLMIGNILSDFNSENLLPIT